MRSPILRAAALLIPAAALAGCGDGGPGREVAELRARAEARDAEAEALARRVKELEARSRALEEQVAALGLRSLAPGAARPAPAAAAAPGAPGAPEAAPAAPPTPQAEEIATYLDSDAGKQKLRDFLQAEERAREQKAQQALREQMENGIRDRVTGYLTEQLGLDRRQQDALVAIALDTMDRMGEVWRGAREAGNDPNFFATARDKTQQIRQEALDRVAQALTAEQFTKFQEIQPGGGGLLGGRGMGPGPGGFGGPGGLGGRNRPAGESGGGAPSPPR